MDDRARRLAGYFRSLDIARGERIALLCANSAECFELQIAACREGLILVPINFRLAPAEVDYILGDCAPRMLITDAAHANAPYTFAGPRLVLGAGYEELLRNAEPVRGDLAAIEPQRGCVILYTSGTTGRPKGAVLSNLALYARINSNLFHYGIKSSDRFLQCLPMFHIASNVSLSYLIVGATNIFLSEFDPARVVSCIEREAVTAALMVPTMINAVINLPQIAGANLGSLRTLVYGASPIPPAVLTRALEMFQCDFAQAYGMTETSAITVLGPADHNPTDMPERLTSAGRPALGVEMRVVDDKGALLEQGGVGEVACRGPVVMNGYWNAPQATADAIRDGWMHTGDLGYVDDAGYLYITDRKKDMIVSGGENVYPREVEDVLFEHPGVLEAAVIGVPDERWGERVHAVLVARAGVALHVDDVIGFARTRLAGYKVPKSADIVTELPKNATGKVLKTELREPFWRDHTRGVA